MSSTEREYRQLLARAMNLMWIGSFLAVVGFGFVALTRPDAPILLSITGYFAGVSGVVIVVSALIKVACLAFFQKKNIL